MKTEAWDKELQATRDLERMKTKAAKDLEIMRLTTKDTELFGHKELKDKDLLAAKELEMLRQATEVRKIQAETESRDKGRKLQQEQIKIAKGDLKVKQMLENSVKTQNSTDPGHDLHSSTPRQR